MYSIDRRQVAVVIYNQLHSLRKTAKLLQVCHTTVCRWLKNPERKQRVQTKKPKIETITDVLKATILCDPFISIRKLKVLILETLKVSVSYELVRIAIKRLGFSRKKATFYSQPSTLPVKTATFLDQRDKFIQENRRIISIDETSFGRNDYKKTGYSKRGTKLFIKRKQDRITTQSVIAAVTDTGWIGHYQKDGSINHITFLQFLKQLDLKANDVVLMDNVRFHHKDTIKQYLTEKSVEILYTPPYSPWFNPIELCFSIVKRTFVESQNIQEAFASVKSTHFSAFFTKSLSSRERF